MAVNSTKFFYPPTPGSGAGTFDNIVGFQVVEGGGLTNAVFDFTTSVTEKVNRTFSIGTFSEPISLEDLDVNVIQIALDSINDGVNNIHITAVNRSTGDIEKKENYGGVKDLEMKWQKHIGSWKGWV